MIRSFKEQQDALIEYLKSNYKDYLSPNIKEPEIITEPLDFDKFKYDSMLFFDFAQIDFRTSNYDDDCGDIEHLNLTVYLVRRNDKSEILQADMMDMAWAFYKMIREDTTLGIAANTNIESIDFFKYVEATKNICLAEFDLSLQIEI
jgi:hypothetical protein